MLDDDARLEDEDTLFEEDEFLLELELGDEAMLEEETVFEDDCKAPEDDNSPPIELLLVETKPLEDEFLTEPELEALACELEDSSSEIGTLYASRFREQENV